MPEDLLSYGLIPEFIGRLPVISAVHQLQREDLVQILIEPQERARQAVPALLRLRLDRARLHRRRAVVDLRSRARARDRRARPALDHRDRAARRDVRAPSRKDVSKCVITKETIEKGLKPTLVTSAGAELEDEKSAPPSRPKPASRHPFDDLAERLVELCGAAWEGRAQPARSRGEGDFPGWRRATRPGPILGIFCAREATVAQAQPKTNPALAALCGRARLCVRARRPADGGSRFRGTDDAVAGSARRRRGGA